MAYHDYDIANQSGLLFRQDLNNALAAIVTNNSASTSPAVTFAFQMWVDTSGANPILKIRNAANSAWLTIGRVDLDNLGLGPASVGISAPSSPLPGQFWIDTSGANPILNIRNVANSAWVVLGRVDVPNLALLPLVGGTLTGALSSSNTDHWKIPVGTTAQRSGSPVDGMIRYNTDLTTFEGYRSSSWGAIGGGGFVVSTSQSVAGAATINSSTTDTRQLRPVAGSSGPQTASTTPFGSGGGWRDGTEILLIGTDDTNTLTLTYNDAAKGLVGNFSSLTLGRFQSVTCVYVSTLDRWIATEVL